ncbi:hypothetical protein ACP4OV_017615 [Aristida adscensionis]
MAEVSTAAAPEGVLHRRIEFHLARRPHAAVAVGGGGFRMETLNPDAAGKAAAAAVGGGEGEARRPEKGEAGGMDPELSVARIYLGRIGAGLQNLGNTCYLNSVLQCLTYTEPFAAYLQSGKHKSSCRTSGFCALCALQNHVKTALQSTGKIVTPSQFVKNLRCISRSFRNSRQEDAHELMVNLLESMHKCCLPSGVPSESPSAYDKSLVHKIFGGRLRSQVKCTRCSHCSNKFDPFLDLSLDIAKATTLVRALQNFTEDELLDGGAKQYQCERCRQKVVAKKRFTIDKPPNVLTIHLKRFSPFNPREKIDKKVEFQPILDLKPFVSDSKGADFKYSLYGVLVHAGWNTQSGHYYCFVRTSSGMWHNLDDNQVRQVREADVLKQKAYMLFYVRDSIGNSMARRDVSTGNAQVKRIPEKIPCLNGVKAQNNNGSSSPYADKKIYNLSNGNSSIFCKTSADHCSKNDGKTEGSAASQNNVLSSAQHALGLQKDTSSSHQPASLISTGQHALGLKKDTCSSHQPTSLIRTGKQTEGPLQQLHQKADLGGNASVASSMVNGAQNEREKQISQHEATTLSEREKQISQHQATPFSKPTAQNGENTRVTVQTSPKDAVISSDAMSSKDLPKGSLDQAKESAENGIASGVVQVNSGKQKCSGDVQAIKVDSSCNGRIAKKLNSKPKKFVRYPVVNMWLGSRQLLVASLKIGKKVKHKRARRRSLVCKDMANLGDSMNEQLTSTSESVECTSGWRKDANANTSLKEGVAQSSKSMKVDGTCVASGTNETPITADLPKLSPSSSADPTQPRKNVDAKLGATQPVNIRATDLMEAPVPRWDGVDVPSTKAAQSQNSKRKSLGYVLDEWDEEYDRGRTKKVRKTKEDFGGPNPFQEEANYVSQRRMKQKSYQGKSWNKLNRLRELRV